MDRNRMQVMRFRYLGFRPFTVSRGEGCIEAALSAASKVRGGAGTSLPHNRDELRAMEASYDYYYNHESEGETRAYYEYAYKMLKVCRENLGNFFEIFWADPRFNRVYTIDITNAEMKNPVPTFRLDLPPHPFPCDILGCF